MSDENQSPADKPHDPTPQKLEKAREKGEITRSTDLNTGVIYLGTLVFGVMLTPWVFENLGRLTQITVSGADEIAHQLIGPGGLWVAAAILGPPIISAAVFMVAPALLLLVAIIAQRGFVVAPSKLAPKLSRISPIENAKNKFGAEGLFQFAKSAAKLIIVSVLLALYLWARAEEIIMSIYAAPGQILAMIGQLTLEFMAVVTALSLAIGAVDWLWEHSRLLRRNRMSREELKDEMKTSEGDPTFKQERRQRAQAIASNRMMVDVPTADVVVVNPTHYAVALKWDRGQGEVPVCVAKGVDATAARIREIATEAGVPIFSDPATARALHATLEVGAQILPDQYRAVAAAIRFADAIRRRAGQRT